jgi:hypothetical protein
MRRIMLYATLGWPSAARYAGGFVAAGCKVFALAPQSAPVLTSRYITSAYRHDPLAPLASLRRAIAEAAPDLLVLCDDRAVTTLLRLYDCEPSNSAIAKLIARSLGKPERYARILSRSEGLSELQAIGVRVPDTLLVSDERALDACLARTGLPAVLKSDGSWGGEGVRIVRSRDAAHEAYRLLANPPSRLRSLYRAITRRDSNFLRAAWKHSSPPVSVQRFVEGTPAASAFAAHQGKVVGAIHYDVLDAQGEIGPPNVIRRVDCPEMEEATRAVAKHFGLSGLHGLDFIRDLQGALHLIEINPRATQGGTLPFGAGRDLPSALMSAMSGGPVGIRMPINKDVVVFFPREWQRNPDSPFLRTGHHDVPWDDPAILELALSDGVIAGRPASPPRTHNAA